MKGVLLMNEEGLNSFWGDSRCGNWKQVRRYSRGATGDLRDVEETRKIQGGTRENSGAGRKHSKDQYVSALSSGSGRALVGRG